MKTPEEILIAFKPSSALIKVPSGSTLLSAVEKAKIMLPAICGGRGKCGKCKIRILNSEIPFTQNEKLALKQEEMNSGFHLACQVTVNRELEVEILDTESFTQLKLISYGSSIEYEIDDHLKKIYVELTPPDLSNPVDDLNNLESSIIQNNNKMHIPLFLLQNLSTFLRKNQYRVTFVLFDNQVLTVEPGDATQRCYGLAFDLGTTTIVGMLIDLKRGEDLASYAILNPQYKYGADVLSRVKFSIIEPGGLNKLQNLVIESINEIIEKLIQESDVSFREIYAMSLAGNAIMNHIFLGVNPQYIGESPYIPTFRTEQRYTAEELGLSLLSQAPVMVLPNISGYIGGDITGFILSYNLHQKEKITLGIDIGTNGEIILGSKHALVCCSAAAGPAFEGGHIGCGMQATVGAIERVAFDDDGIFYYVIGDREPKGFCGTGLIDLIAEMLRFGIMSQTGRIHNPGEIKNKWYQNRIVETENGLGLIVVPAIKTVSKAPIIITQQDIRELQLAKAAFTAGIKILKKELAVSYQDIEEVLIAGAFGSYINKYNAQFIGLIPNGIPPEKIYFVGDAAITGAKKFLLSKNARKEAQRIIDFTRYIELSLQEDFQREFTEAMFFDQ